MTVDLFVENAFKERRQLSRNTSRTPSPTIRAQNDRIYTIEPQVFGVRVGQRL